MHILVTGGAGYIGHVLVPKLLNMSIDVTVFDTLWFGNRLPSHPRLKIVQGDIRNTEDISMNGVTAIIHLANIANDPCGDLDPKLSWEVNVLATKTMIEKAIKSGVKHFVYASSGSVYGVKEEEQVTEDLDLVPISDYNKTKMVAERVLLSYANQIPISIIRPATVCGLSPRTRLDVSVNMFTMQALKNRKITIFGGDQIRPNVHVQDITDVFIYMLELGARAQGIFNAGFENISILEIAERVRARVGAEIVVTESNDPRSYRLNSDKLVSLGFKPRYSVQHAIDELVGAYERGELTDDPMGYNIKIMMKLMASKP